MLKLSDKLIIKKLKKEILEICFNAKEGHLGSSFSILDILYVLYTHVLDITPNKKNSNKRDYFILSKGHASLAHAAVLYEKNFIKLKELRSYCSYESILGGHLDRKKVNGVEVSSGSLGHGISIAVGIALGLKIKKIQNKVFVVVGDGEINEGTFWESLLIASNKNLNNLCCIVDYNRSNDLSIKLDPLKHKLDSFGFTVLEIDGHCHEEIRNATMFFRKTSEKPTIVLANTIKGKGVRVMENNPEWHHKSPNIDELNKMIKELS